MTITLAVAPVTLSQQLSLVLNTLTRTVLFGIHLMHM